MIYGILEGAFALYVTALFLNFCWTHAPACNTPVQPEPISDEVAMDDSIAWETLEGMTLTHLRKLAIAHNKANPTERIAKAARLNRAQIIPALAAVWERLPIEQELVRIA